MTEHTIRGIGNCYGSLTIRKTDDGCEWSVENWDGHTWRNIPQWLYDALMRYISGDTTDSDHTGSFQERVQSWMISCFDESVASDKEERNDRFLEEALELVQACGCDKDRAHLLVEYVYGRPEGETFQEVGGVVITLATLCSAHGIDMRDAGEVELKRAWEKMEMIRAKQKIKPRPGSVSPVPWVHPAEISLDKQKREYGTALGEALALNKELVERIETLETGLTRARELLQPFANFDEALRPSHCKFPNDRPVYGFEDAILWLGNFRAASAFIAETETADD